jgi:hypothetical protein
MKKRQSKEEKQKQLTIDILNKMFEIAGHSVTFEDIKGRQDAWYTQWTMTVEQNDEWQKWGTEEIRKRLRCSKTWAKREMGMVGLMWGLKLENFN